MALFRHARIRVLFFALITCFSEAQNVPATFIDLPSDAEIRKILAERVRALGGSPDGIGIVIGIIGPKGRRVIAYGHSSTNDRRAFDGKTVFEIGSVSKVFTALLLTEMARTGEVALTDPVSKYLAVGVKTPQYNGHPITLLDLASHTSGLPFMADELPVWNAPKTAKPSTAKLYQFLARYQLTRDPGAEWDYSNLGYWLLGEALSSRAGTNYEDLLRKRVITPLKLKSTAVTLAPPLKARMAVGHNAVLKPAPLFSSVSMYDAMPSAGGLSSSVDDLLQLLSVAMGYERPPLAASITAMLSERRPMGSNQQAVGWVVLGKGEDQLVMQEGSTWGYSSYVVWDPARRVGAVALSNQLASVGDIALHLLRPNIPLEQTIVKKHIETALSSTVFDGCTGQYEVPDEGVFNVTREGDFLMLHVPVSWGLPKFRLHPESRSDFFVAELPLRVTFQTDSKGRISGLLLYPPRGQHALPAKKIVQPTE
jgi:CubicO group peptidase (beta-lactamase class C family)